MSNFHQKKKAKRTAFFFGSVSFALMACRSSSESLSSSETTSASSEKKTQETAWANTSEGPTKRYGKAISPEKQAVSLSDIAKDPLRYSGEEVVTKGRVSAVCQEMGCWMELKDEQGEAHIKMAGHTFFIPRDASGKKATVAAKVLSNDSPSAMCKDDGHHAEQKDDCLAEARQALGKRAKIQLEASGVELN